MQIQILQAAPTKNPNLKALEQEFEKRLKTHFKILRQTVPASKSDHPKTAQNEEKEKLLKKIDKNSLTIALTEHAAQLSSQEFADLIKETRDFGPGKIQLIIGGSHGLHPDIIALSKKHLSFSKMTFTHEMVRVFLLEQLYRAATILANMPYHK